jgi:hypothetical protein
VELRGAKFGYFSLLSTILISMVWSLDGERIYVPNMKFEKRMALPLNGTRYFVGTVSFAFVQRAFCVLALIGGLATIPFIAAEILKSIDLLIAFRILRS